MSLSCTQSTLFVKRRNKLTAKYVRDGKGADAALDMIRQGACCQPNARRGYGRTVKPIPLAVPLFCLQASLGRCLAKL